MSSEGSFVELEVALEEMRLNRLAEEEQDSGAITFDKLMKNLPTDEQLDEVANHKLEPPVPIPPPQIPIYGMKVASLSRSSTRRGGPGRSEVNSEHGGVSLADILAAINSLDRKVSEIVVEQETLAEKFSDLAKKTETNRQTDAAQITSLAASQQAVAQGVGRVEKDLTTILRGLGATRPVSKETVSLAAVPPATAAKKLKDRGKETERVEAGPSGSASSFPPPTGEPSVFVKKVSLKSRD